MTQGKLFEEHANPDEGGFSEHIDVVNNSHQSLNVTNGSNYTRKTSYLYKKYYLIKTYQNGLIDTKRDVEPNSGVGLGKLLTIKLNGFK